jgi:cyclopropane-fatty-acyl-phospholipid synthase
MSSDTPASRKRVVKCYSAVDAFFPACGLYDLTEGIYHGNPKTPFEQAQINQHDYLLDQIFCAPGHRVLDIGCGYGTLLERIHRRNAEGIGITLSPEQARYCHLRNLTAHIMDYRMIPHEWDRTFDSIIANGSIEHFVRPADVTKKKADDIYRHLFATVHRLIKPNSPACRLVTTTIHVLRKPRNPCDLLKSPFAFPIGSDNFNMAVLEQGWGGYYPEIGQLQRCAAGYFDLIAEADGTEDYRLTSEAWLQQVKRALCSPRILKIAFRSLPVIIRAPKQFLTLLLGFLASQSWNWQFRPPNPPMRLLRQTWVFRW